MASQLPPSVDAANTPLRPLPALIFASRWLQLPLYLGLIAAQGVYVWHFLLELWHLIEAAFGSQEALHALTTSIGYKPEAAVASLNETVIMLVVLALIDVVMISNLLIMVIVGGYETFVSRLGLERHPDQPEWHAKGCARAWVRSAAGRAHAGARKAARRRQGSLGHQGRNFGHYRRRPASEGRRPRQGDPPLMKGRITCMAGCKTR
jgi:uncharacterized membrane protein YqhA